MEPAYGILCRRVFGRDGHPTPFGAHTCVVPPQGQSRPHAHLEGETFFIARGTGTIRIGDEPESALGPGDVVFIPPYTEHVLTNTSQEELWFTSVWWDPRGEGLPDHPSRTLIIAAPPTPNGDLHLGHLSGPYLALDALARIRRQQGVSVRTLVGSDDHQTYVVTCSERRNEAPEKTADHFSESNQATLKAMGMSPDSWLRPLHDPDYQARVIAALRALVGAGQVRLEPTATPWCPKCDRALVEAYVSGDCPHCGQSTSGNGCEACCVPNICSDLGRPTCTRCGSAADIRSVERLVFPLEPWLERLQAWIEQCSMPAWLKPLAARVAENPTPVFPISHPGDWGLAVPTDLTPTPQRIFAWWEMPLGFLMADPDSWSDPQAEVIQTFGSDNAWYFLTLLPATQLALNPQTQLPKALVANQFLLLDGSKFSTSRRHAIWGDEARGYLSADFIRLCLAAERPEEGETNFTLDGVRQMTPRAAGWYRWRHMVDQWAVRCGGVLGERGAWTEAESSFHRELVRLWKEADRVREPGSFSLRRQVELLDQLAQAGTRFAEQHQQEGSGVSLALACASIGVWGRLAEPIMPELGAGLTAAVGMPLVADATVTLPPVGTRIRDLSGFLLGTLEQVEALRSSRLATA